MRAKVFLIYIFIFLISDYSYALDCIETYKTYGSEIDSNSCFKEIKEFEIYDIDSICKCNNVFSSSDIDNKEYLSNAEKLISRIYPVIHKLSSGLIYLDNVKELDLSVSVCSLKDISKKLSNTCKNSKSFTSSMNEAAKYFSRYGKSQLSGLDSLRYNIANSILYKSYGKSLPDSNLKKRNTCYSDNILRQEQKDFKLNNYFKSLTPEMISILGEERSIKLTAISKENIENKLNQDIKDMCNVIDEAILMACPEADHSYDDELVKFNGDDDEKYKHAYNIANSDLSNTRKIEKISHLCIQNKSTTEDKKTFDYMSNYIDFTDQESMVDSISLSYEQEYGLCSVMCEDAPGPYSLRETCQMRDADTVLKDLGCDDKSNEENSVVQRNCRIVSQLYEERVEKDLIKIGHEVKEKSKSSNSVVSDDYEHVLDGIPNVLVKFLGIEKDFHEEIGVKPDLVTESEFVAAATASNDSSSGSGIKDEYRESGKVKKEWINSGEIRDEFAGSGKSIDSGSATALNTSGFSAQGGQVVIPRSPEAKKINELVEKVKVAKARTQVFRERVDKLEREGKGVDISSRWNNPISSLGSFENNWGVGSDNPAIRGYNSDGTSFEYPSVFNNRFGGVDAGRGRGYGSRGRELNDNEKFTKAMYDRGLKTNISGSSNESVADGPSGGGSSVGGVNSGGGILSSGGTSAGGASRGPASGGSEMSEIAQHFKGLLGGEAAVKRDIKDVEMKQVRVFRNDYNDEGKVVLEELLAEHKDIKIGDPFIVYQYENGDTYRATLLPLFDPDGKLQGYRVDKNDLVGKSREFANSIIASENFLR